MVNDNTIMTVVINVFEKIIVKTIFNTLSLDATHYTQRVALFFDYSKFVVSSPHFM